MTNSYSTSSPLVYENNAPLMYNNAESIQARKSSAVPAVLLGTVGSGAIGAYKGYKKNPNIVNDKATDTFVKKVYENFVNNSDESIKKSYTQTKDILKKINGIKTVDEFKALLNENSIVTDELCNKSNSTKDSFLGVITKENLDKNKKAIKEQLEANNKLRIQNMKNWIEACWNKDKKSFEKANCVEQKVFDTIKKSSKGSHIKNVLKYAGIAGAIGGLVSFITYKLLTFNKQ